MLLYGGFGNGEAVSAPLLIDAIVSVLWYAIIITFHYGLKGVIKANNYRERVKKDLAESRWQIKVERRKKEAMGRRLVIAAMGNPQSFDRGFIRNPGRTISISSDRLCGGIPWTTCFSVA